MQSDSQNQSVSPEALKRQHESVNPNSGPIVLVAGLIVLTMLVCLGLIWFAMAMAERKRPGDGLAMERGIITAAGPQMLQRFPAPNLQVSPPADLMAFRAREDAEMNSF